MPLQFSEQRAPMPPLDLIQRVVPPFGADSAGARISFDEAAIPHLQGFERALGVVDREFSDFDRVLDFGCGPGRFIRHLEHLAQTTEIHGVDIDAQAIEWLKDNVPYGRFEAIPHEPPTSYPDHHFDLILNHSVFTHLPEQLQDAWMGELHRITHPDAVLLLTLHSTSQWNQAMHDLEQGGEKAEPLRAVLERDGIAFVADDTYIGSTHPDFYHTTFHAPWYVFEHWTQWFDLVAYLPLGSHTQDLVVMRRRADDAPRQRPIGHGDVARVAGEPGAAALLGGSGDQIVTALPPPQTLLGRIKRRVLRADLERQDRINRQLADILQDRAREQRMLRAGLYDLGQRVAIVADELRTEMHGRPSDDADSSRV
jgi:SAM-dependent methyltransferase